MRSATSSGCSMKLVVESITPATSTLPAGKGTSRHTFHSCSWRGLAPATTSAPGRPLTTTSAMSLSGRSRWCWTAGAGPADVHAHPLGRNVGDGVVEHVDVHLRHVAELREAQVGKLRVAAQREIGAIDLQYEARLHDGLVFPLHHVGQRVEIFLVARVVPVLEEPPDLAGRR